MIARFNERNRQEKVDRSRHASETGGGLAREPESRTLFLEDTFA